MRGRGWGETKGEYRRRNCEGTGVGGDKRGETYMWGCRARKREWGRRKGVCVCVWGGGVTAGVTIDHRYSR